MRGISENAHKLGPRYMDQGSTGMLEKAEMAIFYMEGFFTECVFVFGCQTLLSSGEYEPPKYLQDLRSCIRRMLLFHSASPRPTLSSPGDEEIEALPLYEEKNGRMTPTGVDFSPLLECSVS